MTLFELSAVTDVEVIPYEVQVNVSEGEEVLGSDINDDPMFVIV